MQLADIVELEHAATSRLFEGEMAKLLTQQSIESSLLTSKEAAIRSLLISYAKHTVGERFEIEKKSVHRLQKGKVIERLRDLTVKDGNSSRFLQAADVNIAKGLQGFLQQRQR